MDDGSGFEPEATVDSVKYISGEPPTTFWRPNQKINHDRHRSVVDYLIWSPECGWRFRQSLSAFSKYQPMKGGGCNKLGPRYLQLSPTLVEHPPTLTPPGRALPLTEHPLDRAQPPVELYLDRAPYPRRWAKALAWLGQPRSTTKLYLRALGLSTSFLIRTSRSVYSGPISNIFIISPALSELREVVSEGE
nr:hypothetical protein Iba_chr13fCG6960 [Ipomoea batatas]